MKRVLVVLLTLVLMLCAFALTVSAKHEYVTNFSGSNVGDQNYSTWATPVYSYLSADSSGNLMLVSRRGGGIDAYYYTPDYKLYNIVSVPTELPYFGGFYETESNYFILSGQTNYSEDPTVEVYRVTKYDKNWQRLGSVGLYNCNTTVPFDAGSARFAHVGNTLVIRTCHEMYQSGDGLNHQANLTFSVNTSNMSIICSWYNVANVGWGGYVSHSFNQFIKYDGQRLVAVDHGDAYPRSVCLVQYGPSAFLSNNVAVNNVYTLLDIPGAIGDNYTGVSVGGFEVSPSTYIVVGNSKVHNTDTNAPRNIYVATASRSDGTTKLTYLTNYGASSSATSTPHLVKISNDRFMVLWTAQNKVCYTILNGSGEMITSVQSMDGHLSDCVPIVTGQKVIWYTYSDNDVTFYTIDTANLTATSKTTVNDTHSYEQKSNGTYHWQECTECKHVINKEKHGSTKETSRQTFNEDGNWETVCNACNRVTKTEKVTYDLQAKWYADGETDGERLTPVLKTPSRTLERSTDYDFYCSSTNRAYSYHYDKNGSWIIRDVTICFHEKNSFSQNVSKSFASLIYYGSVEDIEAQTYTGKAIKPAVKVFAKGKQLKKDVDYTVSYKNNTKIGTATVVITGKGQFFGTIEKTFSIKRDISSAEVSQVKNKIYTGKRVKQSLKVVYNGKTLKEGTDYTLSYKNNLKVGTATVKITGKGGYAGTIRKTFQIKLATPATKAENATTGVKVTWSKIAGAQTYTVYRRAYSDGKWSGWKAIKTKITGTSYTDKTVKSGTTVQYMVRAVSGSHTSKYKACSSVKYLAAPTVKATTSANSVKVTWNKISGAKTYTVYRSVYSSGKWSGWKAIKTKVTGTSYTDKTVKSGATVRYTVRAVNGNYASAYKAGSAIKFLTTPSVKVENAAKGVAVTWNKISGAKTYTVYRSVYSGGKWSGWKAIKNKIAGTTYIDTAVKSGAIVRYTVRAVNGDHTSDYKASSYTRFLTQPAVKLVKTASGINASWDKSTGAKGYIVYRRTYVNGRWGSWQQIKITTATSYTDKTARAGVYYQYTARAYNGDYKSAYQKSISVVR